MAKKSTELVTVNSEEVELQSLTEKYPQLAEMVQTANAVIKSAPKFEISMNIVEDILSATSPEEIFGVSGALTHARDMLMNVPIEVGPDLRFNVSTIAGAENSLGFYAVFDYVNLRTGEKASGSVGAVQCMAQLFQLAKLNMLPFRLVLSRTERPTAAGYYPLFFRPINEEEVERVTVTDVEEEPFSDSDVTR